MSAPRLKKFNIVDQEGSLVDVVHGTRLEFTEGGVALVYNANTCVAVLPGYAAYEVTT